MIKRDFPLVHIKQSLAMFKPAALASYRDRENKTFVYHAVARSNIELAKGILSLYRSETFSELATDGTSTSQLAKKNLNYDLRKLISEFIDFKET